MNPIRHVYRKELLLQFWPAGRPSKHMMTSLIPTIIVLIGLVVLLPLILDPGTPMPPFFYSGILILTATLLPSNLAMDGFAGERERNTLETVLAGPLTPRQLLWGKVLAQLTILGGGLVFALVCMGLVIAATRPPPDLLASFVLGLPFMIIGGILLGGFTLIVGNLASLRSPNVKAAGPRAMGYMFLGMGIAFLPLIVVPMAGAVIGLTDATLLVTIITSMVVAGLAFLGYLAYLVFRILHLTRSDRFQIEV